MEVEQISHRRRDVDATSHRRQGKLEGLVNRDKLHDRVKIGKRQCVDGGTGCSA